MFRYRWSIAPLILCACFRGLDAVEQSPSTEPPTLELEVSDQNASVWEAYNAPRMPLLTLRADRALKGDAERHLFLLRGTPTDDTVEDLQSATLRDSTVQQTVALDILEQDTARGVLVARPRAALTPGSEYTLLYADARASQAFAVRVSSSPAAGAQLVQSLPAALDARVPPNLARALLRFDGYVTGDVQGAFSLRQEQGEEMELRTRMLTCEQLGLPPGDCVELEPREPLGQLTQYVLRLGAGLWDVTGAPVPTQEIAFRTAASNDAQAPDWLAIRCARDETGPSSGVCAMVDDREVALRVRASENGLLSLACDEHSQSSLSASGEFTLTLALAGPAACVLLLVDQAGNQASRALELAPEPDLATVTIDEVRNDPLGPEPAQEYVELLNFGDQARSLRGFTLTTDAFATGAAILSDITLGPGERVLAVPPDFDPGDMSDGSLPQGVRIARLERALSMRNDGATLFLRDAAGRRISASPAMAVQPGQCIARSSERMRQGAATDFRPDPGGGCTPGFASDTP